MKERNASDTCMADENTQSEKERDEQMERVKGDNKKTNVTII